jgi:predicted SpoU family rRNA methylase
MSASGTVLLLSVAIGLHVIVAKKREPKIARMVRQHIEQEGGQFLTLRSEWIFPLGSWQSNGLVFAAYRATFQDILGQEKSRLYGWAPFDNFGMTRGLKRFGQDEWVDLV